jgi:hypothetical protein
MKRIITIAIASFICATTSHAQLVVYDPLSNVTQILDEVENLAEYAEMIDNEVQQIDQLGSQLQQLQQYNNAFGNPASIQVVIGANPLASDLNASVAGQSMITIQGDSQGQQAMTFTANGLYLGIGTTFQTPSGTQVQRETDIYRENAALENSTLNYTNVFNDATQRRLKLRQQIAATTQQLQSATTASEVQKLTGVLVGLDADLADTDKEIDQAASLTLVQDAENRDDQDKQNKARLEEQQTEFSTAITDYGKAFQPDTEAPNFPTQ